ncbi:MAG: dephospho-CoA kinase [Clostridiaceae bacterium]|nr:dephospho-CoA kinase [Clostridiaceae bacterium]
MFVLGITGGIGTGKSTVASILRAVGIPVIDADAIAHELTLSAGGTTGKIAQALGSDLLDADGALDRERVASLAFTNKRFLDTLSAIIHEDVIRAMDEKLEQARRNKTKVIALDVPLPVKRGFLDVCDQVWAVNSSRDLRLKRLQRRGMDEAEAERRMLVQMTREEYGALAVHEIDNNGSLIELEDRVLQLLRDELGQRGIQVPGLASAPG